jgi:hypothetical protein
VLQEWKREWRAFEKAPAGKRFVRRYESRKLETGSRWKRLVAIALGLALIAAGAIMLVIPGPGILFVGFGGALIAREFRWAAVALDGAEVRLRKLAGFAKRFWKGASLALRAAVVAGAAVLAGGAGYLAWNWFLR